MGEYKSIYDKQSTTIITEISSHNKRVDVASGAITSLEEKKKTFKDVKKSPELETQMANLEAELSKHKTDLETETKVLTALGKKKEDNSKEFTNHVETCGKLKGKAKTASISVNDASTTLKNQREYQIQVTTLKNTLISSHEEALTKREEARRVHQNYTTYVTKY